MPLLQDMMSGPVAPSSPAAQTGLAHVRLFFAPLLTATLLSFTYLYWAHEEGVAQEQQRQTFDQAADRITSRLAERMAAYEIVLHGLKGFLDGSDSVSNEEFRTYVDALQLPLKRPGLQGVAILGQPPAGSSQAMADAAITHIEPRTEENLRWLGQDAAAQPLLRDALERTRDTGQPVMSAPVERADDGSAFLALYLPLYRKGERPLAPAERREHLVGWVAALFRMGDVVDGLARELDGDIALAIFDGAPGVPGLPLYGAPRAEAGASRGEGMEAVRTLDTGGRRWTLEMHPLPAFERHAERVRHDAIAFIGVVFSLLAGWFLTLQASGHVRAMALARDMTRELQRTKDDLESTLNAVPDLLFEMDLAGRIHHYRSGRSDLLVTEPAALIGRRVADILPGPAAQECLLALQEAHGSGYSFGRQYALEVRGSYLWFELSVARKEQALAGGGASMEPVAHGRASSPRFIVLSRDITGRRQAEAAMHQLAYFDALTGLPNRRRLMDELRSALDAAHAGGFAGALFYVDLDNFKQINDARGHTIGDSLLLQVAERLARLARAGGAAARLGGDEFVVLIPRLAPSLQGAQQAAQALAAQLRESLDVPCSVAGALYSITGSIGVTLFPRGSAGVEDLLREADTAMYRAKALGRNRVCFFEPGMHADAQEQLALEQDLKQAVSEDSLQVYLQPQVDAQGVVTGGELLLRWHHPVRGHVPPARFIPVAEESGLILRMGARVLHKACEALAMLHAAGQALSISVNVSPRQFRQDDFVPLVRDALEASGAPPSMLILEVTESLLVDDWEDAVRRMTELVAVGVRFSIDDFGTGYSSLAYLKKLPLFGLKIDKSFVQDAPTDANDAAIVQAILSMARHLRLHVVAEGVETPGQAAFLRANACEGLQGYLYGRPEPLSGWLVKRLR